MAWRGIFTLIKGLAEPVPTVGLGFKRGCPRWDLRPPSPALQLPLGKAWLPFLGANPLISPSWPAPSSAAHPLSAQRPFSGVPPSVSPSRVCPPSLAWCPQLWSPPPAHGQHHPAQVSFRRAPAPALGNIDGSPGSPILSPRAPSPSLAQLSCSPIAHLTALPVLCPQESAFS